jgi:pyruvate dehydrogenase E2 component (dihydrolipoamide acetyltransferase)
MADRSPETSDRGPASATRAASGVGGLPVVTAAGGLFCIALVFLALQMRAGDDPAIGAGAAQPAKPPRPVIVRRVIVRRLVEEPAAAPDAAPSTGAAPSTAAAPAASAPAAAAEPAAAAPAPAPAPAPATTQAS